MTDPPARPSQAALSTGPINPERPIAVTPHYLASIAAISIMDNGGNAIEGAIAANAVLGVVLPDTCGIGGDLFALVLLPGRAEPEALNASGTSGSGWSAQELRNQGFAEIPSRHPASITVPGCVDGWEALLKRYGSLSLGDLLEPAITLAHHGFPVSTEFAASLERLQPIIGDEGSAAPLYPSATPPPAGAVLQRADLGATLEAIATRGRGAFYRDRVGNAIIEATDGHITPADLDRVHAAWAEAIGIDVFGHTAWTIPPNSQGYLTLAAAWIFEQLAPPRDAGSPAYHHALIEAYRSVAWERDDLVSDPKTAPLPAGELLGHDRLAARLSTLSMDHAGTWPAPAPAPGGTAYFCTRDRSGTAVSIIQSNYHGIGSARSAGDTGVFLQNRGAGFNLIKGHPNELKPHRRPLHTLSPTLWTRRGQLSMLLGARGGQYQPQTLLQVAAHRLWCDQPAELAQTTPRWQIDGWQPGEIPTVTFEGRIDRDLIDGLTSRGHDVEEVGPWQAAWGPVSLIESTGDAVGGYADPRVSTTAALSQ